MTVEEYAEAVTKINTAIQKINDENVQEVWNVVSDMWEINESEVADTLDIECE